MCQNAASGEYKSAKCAIRSLSQQHHVPPLFGKDAELGFWTDVKNALDDTRKFNTLDQRLGGGSTTPLYRAVQRLAMETMDRLNVPIPAAEAIESEVPVNSLATQSW
ncbi:MAG: hypothetical protein U0797_26205 [Gemmataceae bacterium]